MLPIRTRSVFKSRWMALAWSAGIVWTAVQFVGDQHAPAKGGEAAPSNAADADQPSDADVRIAVKALG